MVNDPSRLALEALAWILADGVRAHRFLDLTGLDPDGLRGSVNKASTHRAVLEFLCAHEPDLIAASEALGVSPQELAGAKAGISA